VVFWVVTPCSGVAEHKWYGKPFCFQLHYAVS